MKKLLIFIVIVLIGSSCWASIYDFTAKISHTVVETGQRFQITFTVNSDAGNFTPPDFSKFYLLSGPNQSKSMQYVNGRMSSSTSISYVFYATEEGEYEIAPAKISVDGEELSTQPIKLEVIKANPNGNNAQRKKDEQRDSNGNELSDYIFIKATADKTTAYVGEKISVTYKLYSRLTLTGINLEKLPSLTGFYSHELRTVYDELQLKQENINGEIYQVAELQKNLLYPQRSGELLIDPLEMKITARVQTRRARSIWDQMMGAYEQKELVAGSKPIKINVIPLPSKGKPEDFSGAVGNFKMEYSSNKQTLKSNDAIDFKINISGSGNLPLIGAPKLTFPPDFEVYDPETINNYKNSYDGTSGIKTFQYLVIPRHSGNFKIEPYTFTYFDLSSKSYKTIQSEPIVINVEKSADEQNVVFNPNEKKDIVMLNKDIRYIHLKADKLEESGHFYGSLFFYLGILGAILLGVLSYFFAKKSKAQKSDLIGQRKSKAKKMAKKRMSKAKKELDNKQLNAFYDEFSLGLFGYFADKFNLNLSELSQETILENIPDKSMKAKLKEVLDEASMARFAPNSGIDPSQLYSKAVELIQNTEDLAL